MTVPEHGGDLTLSFEVGSALLGRDYDDQPEIQSGSLQSHNAEDSILSAITAHPREKGPRF